MNRRFRTLAVGPVFALLGACSGVLDPQGPVGRGDATIMIDSLAIMLVIVVPTIIATLGFAWWYREGNKRARYQPDFAYSGRVELLVWSVPILVVMLLAGVTWIGSHDLDPYKPIESKQPALEVQVVSLDWKWLFIYPEQGVASVNRLVIPAGRPVHFSLTSGSVMTAFFVPQLGSMIYTMNGMTTQLHLQADRPGRYRGMASHFSGDNFSDMHFATDALPPAQFAAWAGQAKAAGPVLDGPAYVKLAQQGTVGKDYTYRAIYPGLFKAIANRRIGDAPGPPLEVPAREQ